MAADVTFALLGGGIGSSEILVIFVVVLLFFGPKRLPHIARMIGKTMEDLRRASQDFKDQIMSIDEPPPVDVTPAATDTGAYPYGDGPVSPADYGTPAAESGGVAAALSPDVAGTTPSAHDAAVAPDVPPDAPPAEPMAADAPAPEPEASEAPADTAAPESTPDKDATHELAG